MPNGIETAQPPQQKRLALFLDGTWNTVGDNTNVWRLKALCTDRSTDGLRQVAYYSRGVGTTFGEKVRGGLFGVGIDRNVAAPYEWLVETCEPGDEIFVFGFSRGAYTARSLAGFIALCGLLKPGAPLGIGQLFERYRQGNEDRSIWKLHAWQTTGELKDDTLEERWMLAYAIPTHIKMVGVWDTVGALGVPFGSYSPDFNPIEQIFAKLKALLRTAAARTVPDLWHAIRQAFTHFTADNCRNSLAAAGYDTNLAVAT